MHTATRTRAPFLTPVSSAGTHGSARPPLTLTLPPPTRVWGREEEDIRLATMPFLTAENDVRTAYLMQKVHANEAEVMKQVPGCSCQG